MKHGMWARGALVVGSISLSWSMITSQSPCLATQRCAALLTPLLSMPSPQDSPASCFWAAMLIRTAALCFARAAHPRRAASPEVQHPSLASSAALVAICCNPSWGWREQGDRCATRPHCRKAAWPRAPCAALGPCTRDMHEDGLGGHTLCLGHCVSVGWGCGTRAPCLERRNSGIGIGKDQGSITRRMGYEGRSVLC